MRGHRYRQRHRRTGTGELIQHAALRIVLTDQQGVLAIAVPDRLLPDIGLHAEHQTQRTTAIATSLPDRRDATAVGKQQQLLAIGRQGRCQFAADTGIDTLRRLVAAIPHQPALRAPLHEGQHRHLACGSRQLRILHTEVAPDTGLPGVQLLQPGLHPDPTTDHDMAAVTEPAQPADLHQARVQWLQCTAAGRHHVQPSQLRIARKHQPAPIRRDARVVIQVTGLARIVQRLPTALGDMEQRNPRPPGLGGKTADDQRAAIGAEIKTEQFCRRAVQQLHRWLLAIGGGQHQLATAIGMKARERNLAAIRRPAGQAVMRLQRGVAQGMQRTVGQALAHEDLRALLLAVDRGVGQLVARWRQRGVGFGFQAGGQQPVRAYRQRVAGGRLGLAALLPQQPRQHCDRQHQRHRQRNQQPTPQHPPTPARRLRAEAGFGRTQTRLRGVWRGRQGHNRNRHQQPITAARNGFDIGLTAIGSGKSLAQLGHGLGQHVIGRCRIGPDTGQQALACHHLPAGYCQQPQYRHCLGGNPANPRRGRPGNLTRRRFDTAAANLQHYGSGHCR